MDGASKKRWAILLGALAATIVAMAYPLHGEVDVIEAVRRPIAQVQGQQAQANINEEDLAWVASEKDPFSPRNWQPPPAPSAAPAPLVAVTTPIDATPPPPPALPFKFVGQMKNGDDRVIYLGRGEQVLLVREGDVLEGIYKVLAIGQATIEFETIPSGLRQTLAIPAQDN